MANAKAVVREIHPDDIHPDAWKSICDLFETHSWVINKSDLQLNFIQFAYIDMKSYE